VSPERLEGIREALARLRLRLAGGEIDESAYDRLRAKLTEGLTPQDLTELGLTPTPKPREPGPSSRVQETLLPRVAGLDLAPGMVLLEQFKIVAELGRGGFGAVFEAEDVHLGERLAVKVLDPQMAAREELLARFRREVAVMRRLVHPRVVRVFDYREERERHLALISMELVEGGSVRDLQEAAKERGEPVPVALALKILAHVLEGLAAAHAKGIIHRDVTPGNILLAGGTPAELLDDPERDPAARLVDFGIAGLADRSELSQKSRVLGTAAYVAPEVLDPYAEITAPADCYGAGAVAYHLLTGRMPLGRFPAPSELREGLPEGADELLLSLLYLEPTQRAAPAEASARAIELAQRAAEAAETKREAPALAAGEEPGIREALGDAEALEELAEGLADGEGLQWVVGRARAWLAAAEGAREHRSRSAALAEALDQAAAGTDEASLKGALRAAQEHTGSGLPSAVRALAGEPGAPPSVAEAEAALTALEEAIRRGEARLAALREERERREREAKETAAREALADAVARGDEAGTKASLAGLEGVLGAGGVGDDDVVRGRQWLEQRQRESEAEAARRTEAEAEKRRANEERRRRERERRAAEARHRAGEAARQEAEELRRQRATTPLRPASPSAPSSSGWGVGGSGTSRRTSWPVVWLLVGLVVVLGLWAVTMHPTPRSVAFRILDGSGRRPGQRVVKRIGGKKFAFRYIPAGEFVMGSPRTEPGRKEDERQHRVRITRGFWMGETEVTQGQYRAVMGGNPSHFKNCGDDCPVEEVSWEDAVRYANALSKRAGLTPCYENSGWYARFRGLGCEGYRLPTEAEWEYAARAGTEAPFWTGRCLSTDEANYNGTEPLEGCPKGKYREKTVPVRSFAANPWGLYEVSGNVWEWVWDLYEDYPRGTVTDPLGPSRGFGRVFRGGGWSSVGGYCRSAIRSYYFSSKNYLGFRLARTASSE